jgi:endonuclease III
MGLVGQSVAMPRGIVVSRRTLAILAGYGDRAARVALETIEGAPVMLVGVRVQRGLITDRYEVFS